MTKIFIKGASLLLIYLLVVNVPSFFLPTEYGSRIYRGKFNYLKETKNKFNTYFLGRSCVGVQFNPYLFDELNQQNTKSFNLGSAGANGLETIMLLNELIENKNTYNTETIFLDYPFFELYEDDNLYSMQGSYFLNTKNLYLISRANWETNKEFSTKINKQLFLLKEFVFYLTKFRLLKDQLIECFFRAKTFYLFWNNRLSNNRGFSPLSEETAVGNHKRARRKLKRDTTILDIRRMDAKKHIVNELDLEERPYSFSYLESLVHNAKMNDINLVFVLFPKLGGRYYRNTYNSFQKHSTKNKINLAHPEHNGNFYLFKYSFDRAHLNKEGADLLTKILHEEYLKIKTLN